MNTIANIQRHCQHCKRLFACCNNYSSFSSAVLLRPTTTTTTTPQVHSLPLQSSFDSNNKTKDSFPFFNSQLYYDLGDDDQQCLFDHQQQQQVVKKKKQQQSSSLLLLLLAQSGFLQIDENTHIWRHFLENSVSRYNKKNQVLFSNNSKKDGGQTTCFPLIYQQTRSYTRVVRSSCKSHYIDNSRSSRKNSTSTTSSISNNESSNADPDQATVHTITKNHTKRDSSSNDSEQKKSRWSNWTGKNSWKGGLVFLGVTFIGFGSSIVYTWGAPERDQDGAIVEDIFTNKPAVLAYCLRAWNAVKDFLQMVRAPTSEKLLPDPAVFPYIQPPYTIVLELSGLLLKPEWDMKMGWRFKKRPGLDYLLQTCAHSGYEVVIFSTEPAAVGYPLTISMDPQNIIWYRLFKEDTRYTSGVHIKDLNCLNRDLSKVILVDVVKDTFQLNPRNGIAVKKWDGSDTDRELFDLAAFLQTVAANKVEDIRTVIQHYNQFDDPMEKFRENQAEVLKKQEEMTKLMNEEKKAQPAKSPFIGSDLRRR